MRAAQAEYEVRVQLLEIYNEQLRDLLDCSRAGRRLEIRNTERSGLNVRRPPRCCTCISRPIKSFCDKRSQEPLCGADVGSQL